MRNNRLIIVSGIAALCFVLASGFVWVRAYADRELPQEKHAPRLDIDSHDNVVVHDDHEGHGHADEASNEDGHDHQEHTGDATEPCCPETGEEAHADEAGHDDGHEGHGHEEHAENAAEPCCPETGEAAHDEGHEGHAHEAEAALDEGHEGHDHEAEAALDEGHEGHDHEEGHSDAIMLTEAEKRAVGIAIATASAGSLEADRVFPGKIAVNGDRLAHIVPTAPGIVREVTKSLGDRVQAGEVMAWIESAELGEAKVDYLAKLTELGCCTIDLSRAQEVHDNTRALLALLETSPSLDALQKMNGTPTGENRGRLVSAYAEYVFAKAAYEREKPLFEQKISSQEELLAAERAFKTADAQHAAVRDTVAFAIKRDLLEANQAQQVREIELEGAERRLHVLGLATEDIERIQAIAEGKAPEPVEDAEPAEAAAHVCTDPNCTGCKNDPKPAIDKTQSDSERLAWYPLRAPFDGTVIDKHITLGEKRADDTLAFTVADLSTVWLDFDVYQKDLSAVRKGQRVLVTGAPGNLPEEGTIAYVAPLVEEQTRTVLARVVLPNPDGLWRPGLFVEARISEGGRNAAVTVPKTAVQRVAGEPVVFVETDGGYESVPVAIGHSDKTHIEVRSGLRPGQRYVARGAFELKAKVVTSGLDPHAGHGH
jgi:membrane fusion protein, heavy metal efflux system